MINELAHLGFLCLWLVWLLLKLYAWGRVNEQKKIVNILEYHLRHPYDHDGSEYRIFVKIMADVKLMTPEEVEDFYPPVKLPVR